MAKMRLKMAKMRPKMARRRLKMAKTRPQDGQDEAQDGPEEAQDPWDKKLKILSLTVAMQYQTKIEKQTFLTLLYERHQNSPGLGPLAC